MMRIILKTLLPAAVLLSSFAPLRADFINGGFEDGDFTGWATSGDASIQTDSFGSGPPEGTYQALITTSTAANGGPFSGTDAVSQATLSTFLGAAPAGIAGSGLKQSIKVNAGDIVTFRWNFLTNEDTDDPGFNNDVAFYVFGTDLFTLADVKTSTLKGSATPFIFETGFKDGRFTATKSGTFSLGFGVLNSGDDRVNSGLLIDSFSVVPEPTSLALAALGAASLLLVRVRHRRARHCD